MVRVLRRKHAAGGGLEMHIANCCEGTLYPLHQGALAIEYFNVAAAPISHQEPPGFIKVHAIGAAHMSTWHLRPQSLIAQLRALRRGMEEEEGNREGNQWSSRLIDAQGIDSDKEPNLAGFRAIS